ARKHGVHEMFEPIKQHADLHLLPPADGEEAPGISKQHGACDEQAEHAVYQSGSGEIDNGFHDDDAD
ncbi:MAG: hypothetical protein ACPF8Y_05485, partial [Flavobacteriales bacterium]